MDPVHVIRHKVLKEGLSARVVAREMGVSRNTVKRYLTAAAPVRAEQEARARPVWTKVQVRLHALLDESPRWTGGKQRLTATRLHEMLVAEGHEVGVTLVKEAVAEWKRRRREVFVPLVYAPGELAEVDIFEVLVDLAGARRKAWMFVMRLMASRGAEISRSTRCRTTTPPRTGALAARLRRAGGSSRVTPEASETRYPKRSA